VSQQPAFLVFCFEGQKVPYPSSSFLPDIKLSWRTSHYYQVSMWSSGKWLENQFEWLLLLYLVFLLMYLHKLVNQNFWTPC